jgi:ribosome-binding protein aMBF1 (putative translation factor)
MTKTTSNKKMTDTEIVSKTMDIITESWKNSTPQEPVICEICGKEIDLDVAEFNSCDKCDVENEIRKAIENAPSGKRVVIDRDGNINMFSIDEINVLDLDQHEVISNCFTI